MQHPHPKDVWAAGNLYEPYVGRWSRRVAEQFLKWLTVPGGRRGALRELLRSLRPVAKNGAIHLIARAWAVRGRVP